MMNGHGPPPMRRSRSRSPPRHMMMDGRKRDRSWERDGPGMDYGGMHHHQGMDPPPPHQAYPKMEGANKRRLFTPALGEWTFELKRSGKPKCRCRGSPLGLPSSVQLPLMLDVVQLPHLTKFQDFLMMDRRDWRRLVYEIIPDSESDGVGYDAFKDYLMRGRNGAARAGVAMEMDALGFKVFILPPGMAARAVGYKAENMIAVLRQKA
ncbi:TPA: hypothetical protein N0F65_001741 [Lagenidium giganteum]|uniref:Uncharacterized protein n=1 Tax=Lagenidium giganteum TaxID=4803 RepID=A0AAV2Z707_9STRA|nr:TPA: hypothetical protein N0F65_001741 [Lagenidium giganteum]